MASRSNIEAPDDDALNWGSESDASHVDGPEPEATPVVRGKKGAKLSSAEKAAAAADGASEPGIDPDQKPQMSSFLLVTYGILAGAFLLYSIGWIVAVGRSTVTLPNILSEIMYQFGEFLAIASPLLWFAAVFILTRNSKPIVRLLWLLLGLVLLVPWPFVVGGA
jgi:hypothetical protein